MAFGCCGFLARVGYVLDVQIHEDEIETFTQATPGRPGANTQYNKKVRIQALLGVYFFVLLVQTLLERELRQAMLDEQIEDLPLYPEGRACQSPTARRVIDVFEPIQRHQIDRHETTDVLVTKLSPLHRQLIKLLGLKPTQYGK